MPPSDTRTNLRPSDCAIELRQRRLADAGRPDEAQDRPLHVGVQLAHGEVLEDAVLGLLEAGVVGVEHRAGSSAGRSPPRCAWSTAARRASRGRCATRCTRRRPAGIFDSRSSSRSASFFTASGMPGGLDLLRAAPRSPSVWSSPSPSSLWIAFSCSRRKYSRWFLPTSDCTCDWIFEPSSSTSSSLMRIRFRLSRRARTSSVSSTSCLTAVRDRAQARGDEVGQRGPGSVMLSASVCRSSDSSGDSDTTCWKFVLMLRCSASISRRSASAERLGRLADVGRAGRAGWRSRRRGGRAPGPGRSCAGCRRAA